MPESFGKLPEKILAFIRMDSRVSFEELALELYEAQRACNPSYDKLCRLRGVGAVSDWRDIPAVPTAAFKEMEMTSIQESERTVVFFSSGTTQKDRSRHYHTEESLRVYEYSLWRWFRQRVWDVIADVHWMILTPRPGDALSSSLCHMFGTIAKKSETSVEYFGGVDENGAWTLDLDGAIQSLKNRGEPVAVLGTAFQYVHLMDELARRGRKVRLPEGSWILETGGYKGRSREVAKDQLHKMISERLGVPDTMIFAEYGMSELSSQAYEEGDGIFRFPEWARARIISPATGREVAEGERGLIRVYDLANIWSVMAVQTEDFGIKVGDGFLLSGRAAQAEARGCSLMSVG